MSSAVETFPLMPAIASASSQPGLAGERPLNRSELLLYTRPQRPPDRSMNQVNQVLENEQINGLDYFNCSPHSRSEGFTEISNYQANPLVLYDSYCDTFAPTASTELWQLPWGPLNAENVSNPREHEQFQSPSGSEERGFRFGSFGTIETPGPSTGSPQEFSELVRWPPMIDEENPIFDLELSVSKDLPPQAQNNAYNTQFNRSISQDLSPWSPPVELEEMQVEPYYVDNENRRMLSSNDHSGNGFSRLGPLMETGEPWNSQYANEPDYQRAQVFEKPLIPGFHGVSTNTMFGPQPMTKEHSTESWTHVFPSPSPEAHTHSPDSRGFEHIFPHVSHPEWNRKRGRTKKLSIEKKKKTKAVRDKGSCWPCFFKKIPCSTDDLCAHCLKIINSQIQIPVLLECFRDPLESLAPVLVPDYVFGNLTSEKLRSFMESDITSWGNESIRIKLDWGLQSYIEVEVVSVSPSPHSNIKIQYQCNIDRNGRPQRSSSSSPLLGMRDESFMSVKDQYRNYVQDFVSDDVNLARYARYAYDDEFSEIPGQLLKILCSWHAESRRIGEESPILREAIETHVNCTIIDRSILLDQESYETVQRRFDTEFPRWAAPTVLQRQIKLIIFSRRKQMIQSVLQKLGKSIRSIKKPNTWISDFCVLAMMCLIMDMTIKSAYENYLYKTDQKGEKSDWALIELTRLIEIEIFSKTKEVFHARHKTRRGGKESSNPLRDNVNSRSSSRRHDWVLMKDLRQLILQIGKSPVRSTVSGSKDSYNDSGRLTSIFLSDFL